MGTSSKYCTLSCTAHSLSTQPNTVTHLFNFYFLITIKNVVKKIKNVITAGAENIPTFLKTSSHSCNFSNSVLVSAINSLLGVMLGVLHPSWVITVDCSFKKPHRKKWGNMRFGDSWPKPCQILWLLKKLFSHYGWLPHLAEASNPIHSLQHSNEMCLQENSIRTICFQDTVHQTLIFNEWIFMECMHVFITLSSTFSTLNVSTQVEQCFVCKTKEVKHIKSFIQESTKPLEILNSCSSITCYKLIDF